MERIHSRGQHLCKFMGTKEMFYIRKESNSHRICLENQHGGRFIVLKNQYGRRDVMWIRSICRLAKERKSQKSNRFRLAKQQHLHVHHAFLRISFLLLHDYNVKMPNFTFWRGRENTRQRLSYSFLELRCSLLEFKSRKNCQHLTNWTRWNKCYKVCSSATSLFKRHFLNRRCRCCLRVSIIISASSRKSRDLTVRVSVLLYRLIALGNDGRESTLQRRSFNFFFFFFFFFCKNQT